MQATEPPNEDHESAPLLPNSHEQEERQRGSGISLLAHEPLTSLTKILLIITLFLLLLSSVFVGLFAGTQHKLNLEREKHGDGGGDTTETRTTTATATATATVTATATATATTTATATATATATSTTLSATTITFITTSTATVTLTHIPTTSTEAPVPTTLPPGKDTCTTPQCIILSASILSSLDTSQDPCENFYDFATGGWLKDHPLPADKSTFGVFEALSQVNMQLIRQILESTSSLSSFKTSYDEELLRKLRDFYTSCLAENELNDIGALPLAQFVRTVRRLYRSKGKESSDAEIKGLTAAVAYLHSKGIPALFSFNVDGDVGDDPNHMSLWFSQPSLGLPSKEYYEEDVVREIYIDVVEKLLLSLPEEDSRLQKNGGDVTVQDADANNFWPPWPWPPWGGGDDDDDDDDDKPGNWTDRARKLARGAVKFERRIAKASLDLEVLVQDPARTYNPVHISNLTDTLTQIHFPSYFSKFNVRHEPKKVILTYPPYLESLSDILDETSSEIIEAYLIIQAALNLSPYLGMDTEAWNVQRSLVEALTGIKKGAVGDRAEYCVSQVEDRLGFAVGRYFVNETFGGESREKGTMVIEDIVKTFKKSLSHIDWMDEKSAKAAAEKASEIRVKVGYPLSPDTRDPKAIARYYDEVHVDRYNFFENILQADASARSKMWQQLGKRRDREAWEMYPSTVNAYYNPPANEIVFPAGILQPPFFAANWPSYLKYGSFGHVAAHELTHAFDSAGRLYNPQGKLEEWWTEATSKGFLKKQDCIVKQFSEYTIDDGKGGKVHVNGNLTSGENIGDTGLIQAYRAWKAQYQESYEAGHEYLLPGLDYTREQLFFISFARIWARNMKPEEAVRRILTDPHSPTRYRVEGTVYNIHEFASAFKCSEKAKLNPPREKQCIFWS